MALNLGPTFVKYIQGIYGNADLDERTIKQLYQVWKTNPQFIIKAYNQKAGISSKTKLAPKAQLNPGQINKPEIADDDLSGITNFGDAFRIANQKGLKQFKWKGTKANPSGIFAVSFGKKPSKQKDGQGQKSEQGQKENIQKISPAGFNSEININYPTFDLLGATKGKTWDGTYFPIDRSRVRKAPEAATKSNTTLKQGVPNTQLPKNKGVEQQARQSALEQKLWDINTQNIKNKNMFGNNAMYTFTPFFTPIHQQGGTMQQQSSQEQELQKAFIQFLVQDAAAQGVQIQSEQDLQNYAQQLGEEGIKAKYQEFMQRMQGGVMAKLGAKLEYIKKLKGICPEGYELTYFKVGGRICSACQKAQKGKKVDATKNFKKDMKNKDEASRDSIAVNKWQDQETMAKKGDKGNFKKGVWIPDRKKYKK